MAINKKRYILQVEPSGTGAQGPQGPPGPAADINLPINSSDVLHDGTIGSGLTLSEIIDSLLFIDLSITSFNIQGAKVFEKGTVLTSIPLTWQINKVITSQSISSSFGSSGSLLSTLRNYTLTLSNANSDFVITLTTNDGSGNPSITKDVSVSFLPSIYTGKGVIPATLNSAFLLTLTSKLQSTPQIEFTVDLGANEFGWIAFPESMNTAFLSFIINGFNASMTNLGIISHTNASGNTENYRVFRTDFANLGTTTIKLV